MAWQNHNFKAKFSAGVYIFLDQKTYIQTIKSILIKSAVDASVAALIRNFTFLNFLCGPISLLLSKYFNFIFSQAEMLIIFKYIDLRVDNQGREFYNALNKYNSLTDEEKLKNENALINSFRNFIKLN